MQQTTQFAILVLALLPMVMGSSSIPFEPSTAMNAEVMEHLEMIRSLGVAADRDLLKWWAEYDQMMGNYTQIRNASICTDPDMLQSRLNAIKTQVEKVRFAWNTKKEQLEKIRDIMNLDDYKNITALFTPLKTFLAEQDQQVNDEDTHLKQEEADVTDEQNLFNTHPCPCVWGQWSSWSSCSQTCGGGTINRSRNITQQAKNAGDSCAGSSTQQMSCNPDPCPIHCDWGLWGEWTTCSKTCGDGNLTRKRVHSILAQYGGNNCTGNSMDTKHCNVQDELRATIDELRAQIVWGNILQCHKSSLLGSGDIFLDASNSKWTQDLFCCAIATNIDLGYQSYEMSVDFNNLKGRTNDYGHPGFVFNVQDDKNYEYVFKSVHNKAVHQGAVKNGGLVLKNGRHLNNVNTDAPKLFSGKVYNLKVQVSANKKFKVFLDGIQLGDQYETFFPTIGRGGVTVVNGFSNTANFKNFELTPTDA